MDKDTASTFQTASNECITSREVLDDIVFFGVVNFYNMMFKFAKEILIQAKS